MDSSDPLSSELFISSRPNTNTSSGSNKISSSSGSNKTLTRNSTSTRNKTITRNRTSTDETKKSSSSSSNDYAEELESIGNVIKEIDNTDIDPTDFMLPRRNQKELDENVKNFNDLMCKAKQLYTAYSFPKCGKKNQNDLDTFKRQFTIVSDSLFLVMQRHLENIRENHEALGKNNLDRIGKKLDRVTKEHCIGFISIKDVISDLMFEDPLFEMLNSRTRLEFDESYTQENNLFDNMDRKFCMNLIDDDCPREEVLLKTVSTENDYIIKTVMATELSGENLDRNIKTGLTNEQRQVRKIIDRYNAVKKIFDKCEKDVGELKKVVTSGINENVDKFIEFKPSDFADWNTVKLPSLKTKIPKEEKEVNDKMEQFLTNILRSSTYNIFEKRCIENYADVKHTSLFVTKVLPTYVQCSLDGNDKKFRVTVDLWTHFFRLRKHAYAAALHLACAKKLKEDKDNTNFRTIFNEYKTKSDVDRAMLSNSINF